MAATARQQQKAATRAAILRAAAVAFDAHGYSATSMAQIADQLRLTKGSVYFHFTSKAELADEVVRAADEAWAPVLRSVDTGALTGIDALQHLARTATEHYREDPLLRAAVRLTRHRSPAGLPDPVTVWIGTVRRHLDRAVGAGELRAGLDVDALAWHLVASFLGTQELAHREDDDVPPLDRLTHLWEFTLDGARANG